MTSKEAFEAWYHPNFFTDPKALAWEAWKAGREQALLDAMNATTPFGQTGRVIAVAIRSLK